MRFRNILMKNNFHCRKIPAMPFEEHSVMTLKSDNLKNLYKCHSNNPGFFISYMHRNEEEGELTNQAIIIV